MSFVIASADAADLPVISRVSRAPFEARIQRVVQTLDLLDASLIKEQRRRLDAALKESNSREAVTQVQKVLDPLCLVAITINPESRVKVAQGPARPVLAQQSWRAFLIKVHNEGGITAPLRCYSVNSRLGFERSTKLSPSSPPAAAQTMRDRWLDLKLYAGQPLGDRLTGLKLEYRVLQLYAHAAGRRDATLSFDVGQGTQDLGFRSEVSLLFECMPQRK